MNDQGKAIIGLDFGVAELALTCLMHGDGWHEVVPTDELLDFVEPLWRKLAAQGLSPTGRRLTTPAMTQTAPHVNLPVWRGHTPKQARTGEVYTFSNDYFKTQKAERYARLWGRGVGKSWYQWQLLFADQLANKAPEVELAEAVRWGMRHGEF